MMVSSPAAITEGARLSASAMKRAIGGSHFCFCSSDPSM